MLQRGRGARFMPGVWVFAGGVVEAADREAIARRRRPASTPTSSPTASAAPASSAEEAAVEIERRDAAALVALDHPEQVPARFDTRFYVALAPRTASPEADGVEMDEARWMAPASALEEQAEDALRALLPDGQAPRGAARLRRRRRRARGGRPPARRPADAEGRRHRGLLRDHPPRRAGLRRSLSSPGEVLHARRTRARAGRCHWPCSSSSERTRRKRLPALSRASSSSSRVRSRSRQRK